MTQAFEPIPFQFDEIKTWSLSDNINGCGGNTLPPGASVCETNYAFDFATGSVGPDETPGFDSNDELVVMARDAGPAAPDLAWLPGNVDSVRYDVRIADETLSAGIITTNGDGFIYIFKWLAPHSPEYGNTHYVQWQAMGDSPDGDRAEACRGLDPVVARRLLACGWSRGNAASTDGQAIEPTLDVRYIGNWTINRMRVRAAGNTGQPFSDLLDCQKLRIGSCPLCETEQSWDTVACPRFLGLKFYDLTTKSAPIRSVRVIQGSESGVTTTRTDWYYGTHLRTRVRLRVHNGVGPLRVHPDFLSGATPANLWTSLYPAGPNATVADVINGQGVDHTPTGFYDNSGATAFNWSQFDSPSQGHFLQVFHETRPLSFDSTPKYYSVVPGNFLNCVTSPEFEAGAFGNAGVEWDSATLDMQDTSCNLINPDDPVGKWREVEMITYAIPPGRNASTYIDWLQRPLAVYPNWRYQSYPIPPPSLPCKPSLGSSNPNTGTRLTLSPTSNCMGNVAGFSLYRANGIGTYSFLARVPAGASFVDASVHNGATYHYEAFAYNAAGVYGPGSDDIMITVVDTTPPDPPTGVIVTPVSHGARLDWNDSASYDVTYYDVYGSNYSGGPYTKINSQPISIPLRTMTANSLDPTKSYYLVLRAVDVAGNQSALSAEVAVTPLP